MGCDIHFYVEKKVDGVWQFQGTVTKTEIDDETCFDVSAPDFYDGRNYNLFAILADVRNGHGFAGVTTGEGFVPISDPRGVPDDASKEYKQIVDSWDVDGHSHSYHTLRQLLDYDWTQSTRLTGWCSMKEWNRWIRWDRDHGESPESYRGSVSGAGVKHLTPAEADALFAGKNYDEREAIAEANPGTYAPAVWQNPYYRSGRTFLSETVPKLLKLAGGTQNLDDVRIVFFFDN